MGPVSFCSPALCTRRRDGPRSPAVARGAVAAASGAASLEPRSAERPLRLAPLVEPVVVYCVAVAF
eukprot:2618102-Lingulodinium_polyedra.AAC.1